MEKKKNKEIVRYVPSYRAPDRTIYEMIREKGGATVYLCSKPGGTITTVKSIRTASGETLKPLLSNSPLLMHDIVKLPSACGENHTTEELVRRIESFLRQWVYLRDIEYIITAYYVLLTWIYDAYAAVPYLRVRGDFGTGKTRFLSVVGALCNKSIFTSGASTVAPLFHLLHQIGGTLILDEADFRFSSETAEITKILNNGNAAGFPVLRCQKTPQGRFETVAYTVFGPKIIASRGRYQDEALESRCISFDMGGHSKDIGQVPLALPEQFPQMATAIRNDLLAFRFVLQRNVVEEGDITTHGVSHRLRQVYAPLLQLCISDQHRTGIIDYAQVSHAQQLADRGLSTEAELLRVMHGFYAVEKSLLSITELCSRFKKSYGAQYDHAITPKWIGSMVRGKLLLSTRKSNGRYVICENQKEKIEVLWERFDV